MIEFHTKVNLCIYIFQRTLNIPIEEKKSRNIQMQTNLMDIHDDKNSDFL